MREGYYHELGIPQASRAKLASAMPEVNGGVAFLVGGLLDKREGTSTEVRSRVLDLLPPQRGRATVALALPALHSVWRNKAGRNWLVA